MRRSNKTYHTEPLVRRVFGAICDDLATDSFMEKIVQRVKEEPRQSFPSPDLTGSCPQSVKKYSQIVHFFKRYILTTDQKWEDVKSSSFAAFRAFQAEPRSIERTAVTNPVIAEAREICQEILGSYDHDVFRQFCMYGKRAALGLPRSRSYLDIRVDSPNGTHAEVAMFRDVVSHDIHLMRATRRAHNRTTFVGHVEVQAVPKTFNKARIIAPDTTLGGFLSRGLGSYIRARLEEKTHIDLALQQDRHRRYVVEASRRGHLATIDLSCASDSFTEEHITALLSPEWAAVVRGLAKRFAVVDGELIPLTSVILMGQGHTFPLQTLLFYAICEATRRISKCRGKVSVYGDDIIVPTRIASLTCQCLERLGFRINPEKSFYDEPDNLWKSKPFFRESCGSDCYGGVDVRPFMPSGSDEELSRNAYLAYIHKLWNGIFGRWDQHELPTVSLLLSQEILSVYGRIVVVPMSETEEAGLREQPAFLDPCHCVLPRVDTATWVLSYYALRPRAKVRAPKNGRVYYWRALWQQKTKIPDCPYETEGDTLPSGFEVSKSVRPRYVWTPGSSVSRL